MPAVSTRHRFINLVQSALLLGLMAMIAWVSMTAVVGAEVGLLLAFGMVAGLIFAPNLPQDFLLSAYQAERITGRDAPGLVAGIAELARRADCRARRSSIAYRARCRTPSRWAVRKTVQSASPMDCFNSSTVANSSASWLTKLATSRTATCGSWDWQI